MRCLLGLFPRVLPSSCRTGRPEGILDRSGSQKIFPDAVPDLFFGELTASVVCRWLRTARGHSVADTHSRSCSRRGRSCPVQTYLSLAVRYRFRDPLLSIVGHSPTPPPLSESVDEVRSRGCRCPNVAEREQGDTICASGRETAAQGRRNGTFFVGKDPSSGTN